MAFQVLFNAYPLTELSVVIFKLIIFATSDYNYKAINIVLCLLGTAAATLVVVRFYNMIMRRSCLYVGVRCEMTQ